MALENLELVTPGTSRGWISTGQRNQPPGFRRLDARNQPAPADPGAPENSPSQAHVTPLKDVIGIRHVDRPVSGMGTPKANKNETIATLPGGWDLAHAIRLGIKPFAELGANSEALSGSQVDSPCSCRAIFESAPVAMLQSRSSDEITLDEVERIVI